MAKEARHKRLYKDSPTLERGEDGNIKSTNDRRGENVTNAEKKSNAVQSGDDGEKDMEPIEEARIQEIKDMHSRHETEMKAIHSRHQKEDAKRYDNPKGDSNEKPDAGKKEIKEVDESKENTE